MTRALIILTSHTELGSTGERTGFWWEELAAPYYEFLQSGFDIDLASPKGGKPEADPRSEPAQLQNDGAVAALVQKFRGDRKAMGKLSATKMLRAVGPGVYDVVFVVGGHGPLWDLADNPDVERIVAGIYERGGIVSAVCHGPSAFRSVHLGGGAHLLSGQAVTGFSNAEEQAVGLTDAVPFSLEDMLTKTARRYDAGPPWQSHVVVSGRIVTGQNPASSHDTANRVVEAVRSDRVRTRTAPVSVAATGASLSP